MIYAVLMRHSFFVIYVLLCGEKECSTSESPSGLFCAGRSSSRRSKNWDCSSWMQLLNSLACNCERKKGQGLINNDGTQTNLLKFSAAAKRLSMITNQTFNSASPSTVCRQITDDNNLGKHTLTLAHLTHVLQNNLQRPPKMVDHFERTGRFYDVTMVINFGGIASIYCSHHHHGQLLDTLKSIRKKSIRPHFPPHKGYC